MGIGTLTLRPRSGTTPQSNVAPPFIVNAGQQHINRCWFLIGPSGAGKTSWCDTLVSNWRAAASPMVICEDDLIREIAEINNETFDEASARCDHAEHKRIMMNRFHQALGVRRDIIIDRHNLTQEAREEIISLLPDSYQRIGIIFTCPPNMLFERLERRAQDEGRSYSKLIVQNQQKRYERPGEFEFHRMTTIDHLCQYPRK